MPVKCASSLLGVQCTTPWALRSLRGYVAESKFHWCHAAASGSVPYRRALVALTCAVVVVSVEVSAVLITLGVFILRLNLVVHSTHV